MNTRYSITDLIVLLIVVFLGMLAYSKFVNPGTAVSPPTVNLPQTIPVQPAFNPTPTPGHQPTSAVSTPIVPEYTIDVEESPTTILVAPATYTPAPTTAACNQPPMNMTDMICKYNIADVQACTAAIQNNAWLSDICQQMKAEFIYMAGANNGNK